MVKCKPPISYLAQWNDGVVPLSKNCLDEEVFDSDNFTVE